MPIRPSFRPCDRVGCAEYVRIQWVYIPAHLSALYVPLSPTALPVSSASLLPPLKTALRTESNHDVGVPATPRPAHILSFDEMLPIPI